MHDNEPSRRAEGFTPPRHRSDVATLTDPELVAQIMHGSHDAFAEVYNRHGRPAHSLATLLGGDDAEDIVQDIFLRLWHQPGHFDASRGPLRSFLMMQIRSRKIDLLRSGGSRRARETTTSVEQTCRSAEDGALARLANEQSWSLLLRLGERQRSAIGLAYLDSHTYREVAVLLALPEGTVKSRIRQGLTQMRQSIERDDADRIGPNGGGEP